MSRTARLKARFSVPGLNPEQGSATTIHTHTYVPLLCITYDYTEGEDDWKWSLEVVESVLDLDGSVAYILTYSLTQDSILFSSASSIHTISNPSAHGMEWRERPSFAIPHLFIWPGIEIEIIIILLGIEKGGLETPTQTRLSLPDIYLSMTWAGGGSVIRIIFWWDLQLRTTESMINGQWTMVPVVHTGEGMNSQFAIRRIRGMGEQWEENGSELKWNHNCYYFPTRKVYSFQNRVNRSRSRVILSSSDPFHIQNSNSHHALGPALNSKNHNIILISCS
jgi:hypothetical protein